LGLAYKGGNAVHRKPCWRPVKIWTKAVQKKKVESTRVSPEPRESEIIQKSSDVISGHAGPGVKKSKSQNESIVNRQENSGWVELEKSFKSRVIFPRFFG